METGSTPPTFTQKSVDFKKHVGGKGFDEHVIARFALVHGFEFESVVVIGQTDARFLCQGCSFAQGLRRFFIGVQVGPVHLVEIGDD